MVKEGPGPDGSWGPCVMLAPPGGEGGVSCCGMGALRCLWGCCWGLAMPEEVTHGCSGLLQAASECGSGSSSCSPEWSSQLEFGTNPAGNALLTSHNHTGLCRELEQRGHHSSGAEHH